MNPLWPLLVLLVAGLFLSVGMIAAFAKLAEETFLKGDVVVVDRVILALVRGYLATPALDRIMTVITWLGSYVAYLTILPLVAFFFWRWGKRRETLVFPICLAGAAILNFILKLFFRRARPDIFAAIPQTGYSFPSGHAMVSLPFYGYLGYVAGRFTATRRMWFLWMGAALALVVAIGLSRIYLGVHFPSDVLAGFLAGAAWLTVCIVALEGSLWLYPHRHGERSK